MSVLRERAKTYLGVGSAARRRKLTAQYPVRSAIAAATLWGFLTWLLDGRPTAAGAIVGRAASAIGFGAFLVTFIVWQVRRDARRTDPGADDSP